MGDLGDNRQMLTTDAPTRATRVLTLDRPDALNAMTSELCSALHEELDRIAADRTCRAVFLNVGVSNCDMGTSWLLPRLIGASRAHELMLTGRRVGAEEAERIGLVAEVVDRDALLGRAIEAAEQVAAWSPWGIRLTKQGMWTALEIGAERSAIEYEDR